MMSAASKIEQPDQARQKLARADAGYPQISVIIPAYNSEKHIEAAVESACSQTLSSIEILVVDDASTDQTRAIVERLAAKDSRIVFMRHRENRGVAVARNKALAQAKGRYIAYLDSDDLWYPSKCETQIAWMKSRNAGCCFTAYETVEEDGTHRNHVLVPEAIDYRGFLKNTVTCSHTVMFDTAIVDKSLLVMPALRRGQDAATWLQVMKAGHVFYGLNCCLAKNRKRQGSLSSGRLEAVRRTWRLYRTVEHLNLPYAAYCLAWQVFHALLKRRKDRRWAC